MGNKAVIVTTVWSRPKSLLKVAKVALSSESETVKLELFQIARAGMFPRSSLLGAGQMGFWEFGEGGSVG